jgi:hypothetical protein
VLQTKVRQFDKMLNSRCVPTWTFDHLMAQAELSGDLFIGYAVAQQREDLALSVGQARKDQAAGRCHGEILPS